MRALWISGVVVGAAMTNLVGVTFGWRFSSGIVAGAATLCFFWVVEDMRRVRRNRREDARLARQIAFFKEHGKWPTML